MKLDRQGYIISTESHEPIWDPNQEMTIAAIREKLLHGFKFYATNCDKRGMIPFVAEWMKESGIYSKIDVKTMKSAGANTSITLTTCKLARMYNLGLPQASDESAEVGKLFHEFTNGVELALKEAYGKCEEARRQPLTAKPRPISPVQHLENKVIDKVIGPLEGMLDEWCEGKKIEAPDVYAMMNLGTIPSQGARFIKKYLGEILAEFEAVKAGSDLELVESYSFFTKREVNALVKAYQTMIKAVDKFAIDKKVVRKNKVKAGRTANKQITKLNHLEESADFSFKSIPAINIPGATVLYTVNVKERKITKLQALKRGGLTVKGASIKDWDPEDSFTMTLSKPQEFFNAIKRDPGHKKVLKLINAMTTKRQKPSGRINQHTLLVFTSSH